MTSASARTSWRVPYSVLPLVGMVVGQVVQNITLPIFADAVGSAGGTPYFVVWFSSLCFAVLFAFSHLLVQLHDRRNAAHCGGPALLGILRQPGPVRVGLCDALNGMMVVFASPSSRTAPYLQAILGSFTIPMTVLVRLALLRKAPAWQQSLSASLVTAGLMLCLGPTMAGDGGAGGAAVGAGIFWPTWFMLGMLPAAFMAVYEEKSLAKQESRVNVTEFVFGLNFWQLIFVSALFWLDVVPGYGMSSDFRDWSRHMANGFTCVLGGSSGFSSVAFILGYMMSYVASAYLLRDGEGAAWQAVATSLVTPLSTLWWALFKPEPFRWEPTWDVKMTFAVLGLVVMVPGVVLYRLRSRKPSSQESFVADPGLVENLS